MKKYVRVSAIVVACLFALIGLILTGGYFAVRWHLTDVKGSIDLNDRTFISNAQQQALAESTETIATAIPEFADWCKVLVIEKYAPSEGGAIITAYRQADSEMVIAPMINVFVAHLPGNSPIPAELAMCDATWAHAMMTANSGAGAGVYPWVTSPEWQVLKVAISKDAPVILRVSSETGIEPRLLVAQLIGEQLRIFNSYRDAYEKVFAPLKLLGTETQFSLGVTGVKPETAALIEQYSTTPTSDFYPGDQYQHLLDFTTTDHIIERGQRIANSQDHYYAYLYTALYLKEVEAQWLKAGFDISGRSEILTTLYNIGFSGSHPNSQPHVGGSVIVINGQQYTFGSLGYEFYYSGELQDVFPYTGVAK